MTFDIRLGKISDIPRLYDVAHVMGTTMAVHEKDYFEKCFNLQAEDKRFIYVAIAGDIILGYVQLNKQVSYPPFKRFEMMEIQDLNVIPDARRQGVGSALIDHCEATAHQMGSDEIAISVGLFSSYGAAQRLYIQKGYVPDGTGVVYDNVPMRAGEIKPMDDQMCLKMTKVLNIP